MKKRPHKWKSDLSIYRQLVDEVAGTFGVLLFVVTAIGVLAGSAVDDRALRDAGASIVVDTLLAIAVALETA